ncbi:universal stress protein [Paradesulfitobacterium aromaticivorans]
MFKKILVPIDGSPYSHRALVTALDLAKVFQAEILVLHVTYTPEALGYTLAKDASVLQDQLAGSGEMLLTASLDEIERDGVEVRTKQLPGHPAAVIIEEAAREGVDLIVMGSRGYGPIAGPLLGSISQRVLQKAECPVLIVK